MQKINLCENISIKLKPDEKSGEEKEVYSTVNWNDYGLKSQPTLENWEFLSNEERVVAALWIKLGGMIDQFEEFATLAKNLQNGEHGNNKQAMEMKLNSMQTSSKKTGMGGMSKIMANTQATM